MFDLLVRKAQAIEIADYFQPAQSFPTIGSLFMVIIRNVLTIAGIVALLAVVIAGFKMVSHAGAGMGEKASQDKGAFTAAVIGLIIIFGSFFIMQIVGTLVGYDFLNPTGI